LISLIFGGCRGLDRLLGENSDKSEGMQYVTPAGDSNVTPIYDQSAATVTEDENLIRKVIGDPTADSFKAYVADPRLVDLMNGKHNLGASSTAYSSIFIDSIKALFRRGYVNSLALNDPGVITSNTYPVPVYQDTPSRWGL